MNNQNSSSVVPSNSAQALCHGRKAMVKGFVKLGVEIAQAKRENPDGWKEQFPCTLIRAGKLIRIGERLGAILDTPEFEQLPDLPADLTKLDLLAKLSIPDMAEVVEEIDCENCRIADLAKAVNRRVAVDDILEMFDEFSASAIFAATDIDEVDMEMVMDALTVRFSELFNKIQVVSLSETTDVEEGE